MILGVKHCSCLSSGDGVPDVLLLLDLDSQCGGGCMVCVTAFSGLVCVCLKYFIIPIIMATFFILI